MKLLAIVMMFFLTSCAQLANPGGAAQTVKIKDAKQNMMWTSCSGVVDDWSDCDHRARKTCPGGYETVDRVENVASTGRELTFRCRQ